MIIREIGKADVSKLAELYVAVFSAEPWNDSLHVLMVAPM